MRKIKLGVLISGGGSNLQSIIDHIETGKLSAEITIVISNVSGAYGLTRAEKHGLKNVVVDHRDYPSRTGFESALLKILQAHEVELVILAGFMRLVGQGLLEAFPLRIMNIHPALLPSFPGTDVWPIQVAHGVKVAGCTVHFVDQGEDTGPIIVQAVVPVLDDDTGETLAARILKQEHRIYPKAIQLYAEDRL
ncbi:MAG: phosphoribosylglycinamide formyltransferase, partial [Deltaproteobacteria bacterium]|nr:phosphoribosylglycinamide formyltransferase [Deltaproteobacteria bacterium]